MLTMAIKQEANRLKMKYQTTDPYDICTSMDIQVIKRPMGASAQSCKGFFLVSSRCKLIVINSDLPESIQRIIIAHELGHSRHSLTRRKQTYWSVGAYAQRLHQGA